jgi:polyketide cyclase/dehydrase/lipid transport protein
MLVNILFVIVSLVALLLVLGLFMPNNYAIEREVCIHRPKAEVFSYIRLLKNQQQYSKWVMTDPNARKEYNGTDGQPGFSYAWESNNKQVGKGIQTIKNISEGKKLDVEVQFFKPFEGIAQTQMVTTENGAGETMVKWRMEGRNKYPMNLMLPIINNMLGKDIQISLLTLKNHLERTHS